MAGPTNGYHYLHLAVNLKARRKAIKALLAVLRNHKDEFDGIAFRGLSGGLIAPIVADALGKHIFAVRKDETSHSGNKVEWSIGTDDGDLDKSKFRWIFLDDYNSRSNTFQSIVKAMKDEGFGQPVAGIGYYSGVRWTPIEGE